LICEATPDVIPWMIATSISHAITFGSEHGPDYWLAELLIDSEQVLMLVWSLVPLPANDNSIRQQMVSILIYRDNALLACDLMVGLDSREALDQRVRHWSSPTSLLKGGCGTGGLAVMIGFEVDARLLLGLLAILCIYYGWIWGWCKTITFGPLVRFFDNLWFGCSVGCGDGWIILLSWTQTADRSLCPTRLFTAFIDWVLAATGPGRCC
jgi:hypothetical protein